MTEVIRRWKTNQISLADAVAWLVALRVGYTAEAAHKLLESM